jgi:hypothetical protein
MTGMFIYLLKINLILKNQFCDVAAMVIIHKRN